MKKIAAILLVGLILVGCGAAVAAGENLVTLDYLNQSVLPAWEKEAEEKVTSGLAATYDQAVAALRRQHQAVLDQAEAGGAGLQELRVKRDDRIVLSVGSGALLWAGQVSLEGGTPPAVDATAGQEVRAGTALAVQHHYLAAEAGETVLRVDSDTAVISLEGVWRLERSGATDYNALADALKAMGIFKGSGRAYGSGYDLELTPTRIEGLVMFIRMTGEEAAALAFTGENPFSDLPAWCERYGAYAYAKGYAKGTGDDGKGGLLYRPYDQMGAGEYVTVVLRALGYQDGGASPDFRWNSALSSALSFGVLNAREHKQLTEQTFYRAQIVYLCYFNLSAQRRDGGTLLDTLVSSGSIDAAAARAIMSEVAVPRM